MDVPPPLGRERGRGPLGRVVRGPGPGGVIASVEGWTVELPESGGGIGAPPTPRRTAPLPVTPSCPTVVAPVYPRSPWLAPLPLFRATSMPVRFGAARATAAPPTLAS